MCTDGACEGERLAKAHTNANVPLGLEQLGKIARRIVLAHKIGAPEAGVLVLRDKRLIRLQLIAEADLLCETRRRVCTATMRAIP